MKRRFLTDDEIKQFWTEGYVVIKGVLTPEEADAGRQAILDLLPRDLNFPKHIASHGGRIKPHQPEDGSQSFFTPELLPLLMNENLYKAASDLYDNEYLRVGDGSVGITIKDSSGATLSQGLHMDCRKPNEVDEYMLRYKMGIGGCYYLTDVEENGAGIHIIPGAPAKIAESLLKQPKGQVEFPKNFDEYLPTMEVIGNAGDFVMTHHLMPHAASRNRNTTARVVQFTRYRYMEPEEATETTKTEADYSPEQLAAMTPLGRKLFGLDAWVS